MRQMRRPLTRADLEELADQWGVRIDDLWPALEAERCEDSADMEETA